VQVLPVSLFGASVTAVALPDLARDAIAAGDAANAQLRARIAIGFRRIAFFVIPSAFAFAAIARPIIALLFQTGRFDADDTVLVAGVLAAYSSACWDSRRSGCSRPFLRLRDTRTPVRIAITSLVMSTLLSWLFMPRFGPAGIAFGSSIAWTFNTVLHLYDLDRRIGRSCSAPTGARSGWSSSPR